MIALKDAVDNFRSQWNWMADKTLKRRGKVKKVDYFNAHEISSFDIPIHYCYLCDYTKTRYIGDVCKNCPIEWGGKIGNCCDKNSRCDNQSLFAKWKYTTDYIEAANLACEIANLPLKEQYREEYENAIN